jgi:hypothetical protein
MLLRMLKRDLVYGAADMKEDTLLLRLSAPLFWDCNAAALDADNDINLILERVFTRGTEDDEKEIFRYYVKNRLKEAVINIKCLDKKTLNYLSIILNIPKDRFKCYKQTLSENPFGNF